MFVAEGFSDGYDFLVCFICGGWIGREDEAPPYHGWNLLESFFVETRAKDQKTTNLSRDILGLVWDS